MVLTPTSARAGYGKSGPATPNHGAQTVHAPAEASPVGPMSLDDTQESLAELENPVDDLPPRDRRLRYRIPRLERGHALLAYDAVVIGGGSGGSAAATFLARTGKRVLVLEKEHFPRFHLGESLLP